MKVTYRANSLGIIGNIRAMCQAERLSKTYHCRRRKKKALPWFSPIMRDRLESEQRSQSFLNMFFGIRQVRRFWPANRPVSIFSASIVTAKMDMP